MIRLNYPDSIANMRRESDGEGMNTRTLAVIAAIGAILVAILVVEALRTRNEQNPPITAAPSKTP